MNYFTLPRAVLELARLARVEDARPNLRYIQVVNEGLSQATVTVTNGHLAAEMTVASQGISGKVLLDSVALEAARKRLYKESPDYEAPMEFENDTLRVNFTEIPFKPVWTLPGGLPEIGAIMPRFETWLLPTKEPLKATIPIGIDFDYLELIGEVFKGMKRLARVRGGTTHGTLQHAITVNRWQKEPECLDPIEIVAANRILPNNVARLRVALMPVRVAKPQ